MTTALLIIDVQQALCSGEYEAFEAGGVIERINHVSRQFRQRGAPVVVIQHEAPGTLFAHDSPGWQLAPRLEVAPTDIRIRKATPDSFHRTDLQAQLLARDVRQLVICGLQSEFCVDTTTRRALALGYPVQLVADGHSTCDNEVLSAAQISAHHNHTLANMTSFGPRAVSVAAHAIQIGD